MHYRMNAIVKAIRANGSADLVLNGETITTGFADSGKAGVLIMLGGGYYRVILADGRRIEVGKGQLVEVREEVTPDVLTTSGSASNVADVRETDPHPTEAKMSTKTVSTAQGTAIRGTSKALRDAGIDLARPVIYGGTDIKAPVNTGTEGFRHLGVRYEYIDVSSRGVYGFTADNKSTWLGGVATRMWLTQVEEAPAAADDDLDAMTFPQLMEIAKSINLKGRGVARKPELVAGIRAHRAA